MAGRVLTEYSSHANVIADTFRAAFTKAKVGDHAVEMTAPEDSTKGGLLALQHITLKPSSGMALVAGTVNVGEKHAELRSYAHIAKLSEERFKRPPPFDEATYREFLEKAESILGALGLDVVVREAPVAPAPAVLDERAAPERAASGGGRVVPIVVGILIVATVAAGAWLATHR